jgi:hypothetical protein
MVSQGKQSNFKIKKKAQAKGLTGGKYSGNIQNLVCGLFRKYSKYRNIPG